MAKRLFIIDAMAMAFRSHYAIMRPLSTKAGQPTSAVFGSAMFINRLIEKERPDYLMVATDSREPTFRHKLYEKYKANRKEMPPDLAAQLPHFFKLLEAFGLKTLAIGGLEADDLIGAIAKHHAGEDLDVYIVSGDKDFMQLVNDHVFLYRPKKGDEAELIDRAGVKEKFGVTPEQVIDCLAIIGDTSDNVPGVHGIGEKGAAKLINEYGSLDGIYAHLGEIANKKQREALEANKEMAYLSRQLVTIKTDCDGVLSLDQYACDIKGALANPALLAIYQELEFKLLADKQIKALGLGAPTPQEAPLFAAEPPPSAPVEKAIDKNPAYVLANTREKITAVVAAINAAPLFCFDTETTGLNVIDDKPIGISLALHPGAAFYVPIVDRHLDGLTGTDAVQLLKPVLEAPGKKKIGHNVKFDLEMLQNVGIVVAGPLIDTMIADWLLDATARLHGLDACCLKHLNYEKIKTASLIGEHGEISMLDSDLDDLTQYACEDADLTLRLYERMMPQIEARGLTRVLTEVEMPLVAILGRAEREGIYIDTAALATFSDRLKIMADELEKRIYVEAGEEFNINSPKQLGDILFTKMKLQEKLGIKSIKKTKSGFSTDVSVLQRLAAHPLPRAILEYRGVAKLKNTYVDALPQLVHAKTHRIHTSFNQTGTATGRLSSTDPNLQNIPIRSELGQEIRKAFRAQAPGWCIVSADYSQIELRLLAHLAGEENLAKAFAAGDDIHRATAAKIFGVEPEKVDATMRSRAKAINFGIIYGMGPRRLAQETGVSMAEASAFIERYFASYPGIQHFIDKSIKEAKEDGGSRTITGRFRPIDGLNAKNMRDVAGAENIAVNSPIQGSAADLIKLAMIKVDQAFRAQGVKARMLLQVHDELVFECPDDELATVEKLIDGAMRSAMPLSVPLDVSIGHGSNWLEAH